MDKSKYFAPRPLEEIEHPRWGKCYVRRITVGDAQRIHSCASIPESAATSMLVGMVDENGEQIFSDDDLPQLKLIAWDDAKHIVPKVTAQLNDDLAKKNES